MPSAYVYTSKHAHVRDDRERITFKVLLISIVSEKSVEVQFPFLMLHFNLHEVCVSRANIPEDLVTPIKALLSCNKKFRLRSGSTK